MNIQKIAEDIEVGFNLKQNGRITEEQYKKLVEAIIAKLTE